MLSSARPRRVAPPAAARVHPRRRARPAHRTGHEARPERGFEAVDVPRVGCKRRRARRLSEEKRDSDT